MGHQEDALLRLLVGSARVAPLDLDQIHLHALHSSGGPDVLDDVLFRLLLDGIAGAATAERVALLSRDVARDLVGAWRVALKGLVHHCSLAVVEVVMEIPQNLPDFFLMTAPNEPATRIVSGVGLEGA